MLAWLLALPPIARVHFFETSVAKAIVHFKWKAFGRKCTMTNVLWFSIVHVVTILFVLDMEKTLITGKVSSTLTGDDNLGMVKQANLRLIKAHAHYYCYGLRPRLTTVCVLSWYLPSYVARCGLCSCS